MVNQKMKGLGESRSVIRELFEYGKKLKTERGEDKVFDFTLGNPNVPAPDCVKQSILKHLENPDVHGYTSAQGDFTVRKKIADYNNENWNVGITPDDIYMTYGAASALLVVFAALNAANDEIIAIAPYFPEYKLFVESAGAKFVVAKTKADFSLDVDEIAASITKNTCCIILNSPNNPAGNVYPKEDIVALSRVLGDKQKEYGRNIYLVSDEPYREISYDKEVVNPMNFYDNTIICYSFSKTLSLAGERIGYIAISPNAAERREIYAAVCGAGRAFGYVCAPSLFQFVIADCLGKTADVGIYRRNRDLLYGALKEYGFECVNPDGAFYLFVKCPIEPKKFFEICKEHGILIVPSESFGAEGYVRIAYCVATDTIERALPYFKKIAAECGL